LRIASVLDLIFKSRIWILIVRDHFHVHCHSHRHCRGLRVRVCCIVVTRVFKDLRRIRIAMASFYN
jgi:hypothetical protein